MKEILNVMISGYEKDKILIGQLENFNIHEYIDNRILMVENLKKDILGGE